MPTSADNPYANERREWARTLVIVLSRLPTMERAVVTSAYLDGRSHTEIARELGLSTAAVAHAMAEALATIGRAFESAWRKSTATSD